MGSAPRLLQLVFMHTNSSTLSSVMGGRTAQLSDRRFADCAAHFADRYFYPLEFRITLDTR
jgi:hypothetical protein